MLCILLGCFTEPMCTPSHNLYDRSAACEYGSRGLDRKDIIISGKKDFFKKIVVENKD